MDDQRPAQAEGSAPAPAPSEAPSRSQPPEAESGFFDRLIRGVGRSLGLDGPSVQEAEPATDAAEATDGTPSEPDWTPPTTRAAFDAEVDRLAQSKKDKELARLAKENADKRTAAEWEDLKQKARDGDVWALGEIAKAGIDLRVAQEDQERLHGEFLKTHVPLFDKAYLDPLLAALPEDVWKPIVGESLTTFEEREAAVRKAITAHRERAVADALVDPRFVTKLLASPAFREAWLKSDVVRTQYMHALRGGADYDEPGHLAGVAPGRVTGDEATDMDAILRGQYGALKATYRDRVRAASNRDLTE